MGRGCKITHAWVREGIPGRVINRSRRGRTRNIAKTVQDRFTGSSLFWRCDPAKLTGGAHRAGLPVAYAACATNLPARGLGGADFERFCGAVHRALKPFALSHGKLTLHKKIKHGRVLRRRNLLADASGQSPPSPRPADATVACPRSRLPLSGRLVVREGTQQARGSR